MRSALIALVLVALPVAGLALSGDDPLMRIDPDLAPNLTPPPVHQTVPSQFFAPQTAGRGAEVVVDTNGNDNYVDADYYGVHNIGTETVASVTFDISSYSGAFFDLDGGACYGNATDPVITSIGGMSTSDITWTYDAAYPHPVTITANISPAMAPGAYFLFGCDTDFFVSDPCPGGNFGLAPATASVTFSSGTVVSDVFAYVSTTYSAVTLSGGASFTLSVSPDPLQGGSTAKFVVTNATPNELTYLGYSVVGPGSTYIPPLNVTLGLANPVKGAGPTMSDPSGALTWTLTVPNKPGLSLWLQAAQKNNVSNVVATSIL